jgi:hypothetical protein
MSTGMSDKVLLLTELDLSSRWLAVKNEWKCMKVRGWSLLFPRKNKMLRQVVLVTQDECIFQAHDGRRKKWQEGSRKILRPKCEAIMVSSFLCPCHGIIRISEELASSHGFNPDSMVVLHPGVNMDGHFTNEDLAFQTKHMLEI